MSIIDKFEELKRIKIIKDFSVVNKPNGEIDYDIEFYDDLPPRKALAKLDWYLAEKYNLFEEFNRTERISFKV